MDPLDPIEHIYDIRVSAPHRDSDQQPAAGIPGEVEGPRIAFFGGSFDPPHLGHLAIARAARDGLGLDRVLFAPVGAQPLKPRGSTAVFADRLEMTRRAIAAERGFGVSLLDAPNPDARPNYTLETLRALRAELPAEGALYCLMGADSFLSLRRWHGAAEIPFVAWLIVASRPGQRLDDLAASLPEGLMLDEPKKAQVRESVRPLSSAGQPSFECGSREPVKVRMYLLRNSAGTTAPFYVLPGLDVKISASEIRRQVRCCFDDPLATRDLLPVAVAEYIRERGLYR